MKCFYSRFFAGLALCAVSSFAVPQDSLGLAIEDIESRRGINISGNARSTMYRSHFSSPQDINAYDKTPDTERSGFSQLDLNFGLRPWEEVRGNFVLRMGANYQDFFQALKTVITVPWISMEGQHGSNFYWVVGDFREQYSPLTLFSPDVEILYEPEVYRRSRYMAKDQVLLQGNKRNLQGANAQFRYGLGETLGELRAEVIGARLRRVEVLDSSGYVGNIRPNENSVPGSSQASPMDKFLYMGNLEWLPFSRNVILGLTPIFIRDIKTTYTSIYKSGNNSGTVVVLKDINPGVIIPEKTMVLAGRLGADIAGFTGNENLMLDFVGEFAHSEDWHYSSPEKLKGNAVLVQALAGWQNKDAWLAKLNIDGIVNDSSWYNPLAQSPAFVARRIANSDKDTDLLKNRARSPFYSSFDALYNFNPKFTPASADLGPGSPLSNCGGGGFCPTESYDIAPFPKNSYNTSVYTRDELDLLNAYSDPVLQGVLPNGMASANRVGARANLTAGFGKDSPLEVQALFAALNENKALGASSKKAKFTEMGGGGRFDIGSFLWDVPLELSGSYKSSKTERGDIEFKSDFINAGFYVRYFKRFGAGAGFQQIKTKSANPAMQKNAWHLESGNQSQWKAGLDYTLAKNAWVAINYGQISVKNNYQADDPAKATGLLPVYIVEARNAGIILKTDNKLKHDFQQNVVEASVNVDF
ncbi:MAG: hypothetical protein LBH25_03885 [Fibromonadaceae bacterium]|jgi:hypothetical protein|nr:hypothetical protein [Fibromonadaceae bacterium]